MFFVLSSGRSGSETITFALDSYTNCECYHHPQPEFVIEATEFYYGEYGGDKIAETLCETRPQASSENIYGEVNLQLSLIVPVIEEVFTEAKYIWLLRDGRDNVASMYYRGWYDPDDIRVPDDWIKARLQGDRTGDFSSDEWKAMSRFAKCCWLWKKYNLIIESHLQKLNRDRWMSVRLDHLKTKMPQLAGFLGLSSDDVLVEKMNAAYQPVIYWNNWDKEMKETFQSICGEVMDRWFPEWRSVDGIWRKISSDRPDRAGFLLQSKRLVMNLPSKARYEAGHLKKRVFRYFNLK